MAKGALKGIFSRNRGAVKTQKTTVATLSHGCGFCYFYTLCTSCNRSLLLLVEVVEEGGDACEGGLACVLNLDSELNLRLSHAAQLLDGVEVCDEAHALS